MKQEDLLEQLAELEHQQWMSWAKHLMATEQLATATVKRWQSYFVPYAQLPEDIKELDRNYARKVLTLLQNKANNR